MVTVRDVPADALIEEVAKDLRDKLPMPSWAKFVKTASAKERPPEQEDWWWIRAASLLRKIYLWGPIGVSRLRTWYGARKDHQRWPSHRRKGSGKIIRTILQELEKLGLVEKTKKGRKITPKGQSYLDNMAKKVKDLVSRS